LVWKSQLCSEIGRYCSSFQRMILIQLRGFDRDFEFPVEREVLVSSSTTDRREESGWMGCWLTRTKHEKRDQLKQASNLTLKSNAIANLHRCWVWCLRHRSVVSLNLWEHLNREDPAMEVVGTQRGCSVRSGWCGTVTCGWLS
jgi:hypothetical protein